MDPETLRAEAEAFPPGSPDYESRRRAAWQITQGRALIHPNDWTPVPAWFWSDTERKAA